MRLVHMPSPTVNKAAHFGFENQRRHHQKSKNGVLVDPQKGHMSFKKIDYIKDSNHVVYNYSREYNGS